MNLSIRMLVGVAAFAAVLPVLAQEEENPAAEETEVSAAKHISEIDQRIFTTLPFCKRLEGRAEVLKPGSEQWDEVEDGSFYPLGSRFRTLTLESRLELGFGREVSVSVVGLASFGTRQQGLEEKSRSVTLDSGTLDVKLPLNFPEKLFTVAAPGFTVENPAGDSRYVYSRNGDGDIARIRCISGMLTVVGRHFSIPTMRAANEVEIRTSQDVLFTGLFGKSGDFLCVLDGGLVQELDLEDQQQKIVPKTFEWKLSPQTAVRIHRKVPAVGERLAVNVLTFNSNGELCNRWTFTEGRHELNTGDQGPASVADRARAAKELEKAAAAAVAPAEGEAASEDGGSAE